MDAEGPIVEVEEQVGINMHLPDSVLRSLEIFNDDDLDDQIHVQTGPPQTLYQLLNKCRSTPGRKLLKSWLRSPLCEEGRIKQRLDLVEALYNNTTCRGFLHDDLLRRVPDIPALAKRAKEKKFTLIDCHRLYQVVKALHVFESCLEELRNDQVDFRDAISELLWYPIATCRHHFANFVELVETMLDLDYYQKTREFRISPSTDKHLTRMDEELEEIKDKSEEAWATMKEKMSMDSVRMGLNPDYGYFFRVTLRDEVALRDLEQEEGIRIIDTSKDGVRFSTDELQSLNDEYLALVTEYMDCQEELQDKLLVRACDYLPAFQPLSDVVSLIDVLVAFAQVAATSCSKYVRPSILSCEEGTGTRINLIGCRHPVIETSEYVSYIPNDLKYREDHADKFIILTGANMGGKSTYLRSIAITALMAQMGSFVPCDEAQLTPFDAIYTRIGAEDFQCQGTSTFKNEMEDCAKILGAATEKSLVIVDELGRGTSIEDGLAIAKAIAKHLLTERRCFALFATHFHDLTELEKEHKGVRNMMVETDVAEDGSVSLLYNVVDGISDRSFGMNVARVVGLPEVVVTDATEILARFESEAEMEGIPEMVAQLKNLAERTDLSEEQIREQILRIVPKL